ncbi:MAG: hypothetical protein ABFC98_06630 [Candidatus Cloacimonas sp.]
MHSFIMGNLRDKYTDEEWDKMLSKIDVDRKNGKPNEILLHLSIWNKNIDELRKLRTVLSDFYSNYDLSVLDKWIVWKSR